MFKGDHKGMQCRAKGSEEDVQSRKGERLERVLRPSYLILINFKLVFFIDLRGNIAYIL